MKEFQEFILDALASLGAFALMVAMLALLNGGEFKTTLMGNMLLATVGIGIVVALKWWGKRLTHRRG